MREFPEEGEYVLVRIKKVMPFGAFAELLEYPGKEGFIHVSEIATFWVKSIRSHVKEGQIRVAKVLKVVPEKNRIDLSLRRVGKAIEKRKMEEVRRKKRAKNLLSLAAKQIGKEEEINKIWMILEEKFEDVYDAFEQAAIKGLKALQGIPDDWAKAIAEIASKYVEVPRKTVRGEFKIIVPGPRGVEVIREVLTSAKEDGVRIYYLGAPRYAIEVTALDYKEAEEKMRKVAERIVEEIKKRGGVAEFESASSKVS